MFIISLTNKENKRIVMRRKGKLKGKYMDRYMDR